MEQVRIQTTQNVRIDYDLATLGDRVWAWLLDYILGAFYFLAWLLIFDLADINISLNPDDLSVSVYYLLVFLPYISYHFLAELFFNGQSLGKKLLKIKVVKLDGSQPSIGAYLFRWVSRLLEFMLFPGLAMFVYLFSYKGQRLGDIMAGTTVVRMKKKVLLEDTALVLVEEGYIPTFPQVRDLSHRDMEIIREAYKAASQSSDYKMMEEMYYQLRKVLNIDGTYTYQDLIEKVLKDWNYYQQL